MKNILINKFLIFSLFLALPACETVSTYKVESKQFQETISPAKGLSYRYRVDLKPIEADIYVSFSRFNFDYGMLFEVENRSKVPLSFDVDEMYVVREKSDKRLGVEKVWENDIAVDGKRNSISKEVIVVIAPGETKKFSYVFEKIPAFWRRHYGSENEKHLKLIISGLSHLDKKVPVELDLILR